MSPVKAEATVDRHGLRRKVANAVFGGVGSFSTASSSTTRSSPAISSWVRRRGEVRIFPVDRILGMSRGPAIATVTVVTREDLAYCCRWSDAFSGRRKDRRFYELVEDTLAQGFDHRYLVIADGHGKAVAVQPCFLLDQDLLGGISGDRWTPVDFIRRVWPRFLKIRTLMIGCAVGEGHLDGDRLSYSGNAALLARELVPQARSLKATLIVLKEFPAAYRKVLDCLIDHGFSRVPSLPMTRLDIG
ncbi:MAG: hypothetical protein ACREFQ_08995, partial [Stellaceae bacterium]